MKDGNDHYFVLSLGTDTHVIDDNDKLNISNESNYYTQTYTVTAKLYDSENTEVGSKVSMTSAVDNVRILETWIINSQAGIDKVTDYGKKVEDFLGPDKTEWSADIEPWIGVAYYVSSPGSAELTITYNTANGVKSSTFTNYVDKAGTYVFTAWLNGLTLMKMYYPIMIIPQITKNTLLNLLVKMERSPLNL